MATQILKTQEGGREGGREQQWAINGKFDAVYSENFSNLTKNQGERLSEG